MGRLFGTDGIRGVAGVDVTAALARSVAQAAVAVLAPQGHPLVIVGRDSRPSGPELAVATVDGLLDAGADAVDLGVIPTPAVAHALAAGLPGAPRMPDFGVVISASHNPAADNGIKLFGRGGSKLPAAVENAVETALGEGAARPSSSATQRGRLTAGIGTAFYADHLLALAASFGGLEGVRVVLDCANGAAAAVAPEVFARAGADVSTIATGAGDAINDGCGATHLEALQAAVVARRAQFGLAFDGDADRCLAVDEFGAAVDGDAILAILALSLHRRDRLAGDAIAATVMSNQGLVVALGAHGIEVRRTDVGDRAVLDRIAADGLSLGGEQSGHIVLAEHATTGDGLLTGLALAAEVGPRTLSALAAVVTPMPQVLLNVRVPDKTAALAAAAERTAAVTAELGSSGRVLVRPSGTEPLLRIMVEATTVERARGAAEAIAAALH